MKEAADAFAKGSDPFSGDWLAEHEVTLDECFSLSEKIAAVLKGYLASPPEIQQRILMAYAIEGTGIPFSMVDSAMKHGELTKRLNELNKKVGGA